MKKKINNFYNYLHREIKSREKYISKKSEKWKQTITGDKYQYHTDMLYDLFESITNSRCYNDLIK